MKFKELKKKIIEMFELITADCENCEFVEECVYRKRNRDCWGESKRYYKRKK